MIIHPIVTTDEGAQVRTSVRIEWPSATESLPETLWFTFPNEYKNALSRSAHGFLLALLPVAMILNEDITVRGYVSPSMMYRLRNYQALLHFWKPKKFHIVSITADLTPPPPTRNQPISKEWVLLPFSGGVDSFYSLWSHLPAQEPLEEFRVTHALFIHGWDIDLSATQAYEEARVRYERLIKECGVTLIPAATNAQQFRGLLNGEIDMTLTSFILSVAFFFEDVTDKLFFSEDNTPDYPPPGGLNRHVVPILSSGQLEIISIGNTVPRLEKLRTLATWPATYDLLRPCWKRPCRGIYNCCMPDRCGKCGLTMTALDMLGVLPRYTTFHLPIDRKALRRVRYEPVHFFFPRTWIAYAEETSRRDYALDYRYILVMSYVRYRIMLPAGRIVRTLCHIPRRLLSRTSAWGRAHVPLYGRILNHIKAFSL